MKTRRVVRGDEVAMNGIHDIEHPVRPGPRVLTQWPGRTHAGATLAALAMGVVLVMTPRLSRAQNVIPSYSEYAALAAAPDNTVFDGYVQVWCPGNPPTLQWSCHIHVAIAAGTSSCGVCEQLANAINSNVCCQHHAMNAVCDGSALKVFTDVTTPCPGAYVSFSPLLHQSMPIDWRHVSQANREYFQFVKVAPLPGGLPHDWADLQIARHLPGSDPVYSASVLPDSSMPATELASRLAAQLRAEGDSLTTLSGSTLIISPGGGTFDVLARIADPNLAFSYSSSATLCTDVGESCATSQALGMWRVFPTGPNTIRVVFNQAVTNATASNSTNYSLQSFETVNSATMVAPNAVDLSITSELDPGTLETLVVNGVTSAETGITMVTPQSKAFRSGVLSAAVVQQPDPDALGGVPCVDRSRFAGADTLPGESMTVRGVCTASFGTLACLEDAGGGTRSGLAVSELPYALMMGHDYEVSGRIREFDGRTELWDVVSILDLGSVTLPTPQSVTLLSIANRACDPTQSVLNGDDFDGVLVRINSARVVEGGGATAGFEIAAPASAPTDSVLVVSEPGGFDTNPDSLHLVNVTGVLSTIGHKSVLFPRSNSDIQDLGLLSVPQDAPPVIRFVINPTPSSRPRISFTLRSPAAVRLEIFDVSGRRIALLVDGRMVAGEHTRAWEGLTQSGSRCSAGLYFCRLTVDGVRAVRRVVVLK